MGRPRKSLTAHDATIPALGLGTWDLRGDTCIARVADALELGYRHIDTAEMYDNHREVGAGIRRSRVDREQVFLTTKVWRDDLTRRGVLASTERALTELGTEYVDLLLIHWPSDDVPLEHTLDAMLELRAQGKVRHLGVSNFAPPWLERAVAHAPIVCNQIEYHPFLAQDDALLQIREHGLALIAYCPLAHGRVATNAVLREIGQAHRKSPAQVALRWLLQQDSVGAIPKAADRRHLEQNFDVFDFCLDDLQMHRVGELADRGERLPERQLVRGRRGR